MKPARIEVKNGNDELSFVDGVVTIGGRTGVDVVIEDVMVADRHCSIVFEDGFRVRDAGSVTGTWLDGQRASPAAELRDGSKIVIGSTRIDVAISDDDGTKTLRLTVDPQSFWWQKSGKGVFDSDPDQLVYSETKFARFPALQLSNRVAMLAGLVLLVAATFVSSVMAPLADPGPLQPTHAVTFAADVSSPSVHAGFRKCVELSAEQGCNVCHTTGKGTPEGKCLQCHALAGELAAAGSFRHPYHNDGKLGLVPGMQVDAQFCVTCHTDHAGATSYKAATEELRGQCARCHDDGTGTFDREALIARAVIKLPPPVPRQYSTYRFPHAAHLAKDKQISCEVCHRIDDDVLSDEERGLPDDPLRPDYAEVPYEVCASCHVAGTEPVNMTAAEQLQWRPEPVHRWQVTWHGTDNDGKHCASCHDRQQRDSAAVFGPELKTVERGAFTADLYAANRARYRSTSRSHDDQFALHDQGKQCRECHLDNRIAVDAVPTARTFWHALHVENNSLDPKEDNAKAARISADTKQGCASCHDDLDESKRLTPASEGAFHWPADAAGQTACKQCHRENLDQQLVLQPAVLQIGADNRRPSPDFPHDVHLTSPSYGKPGALERGCFACHVFEQPSGGDPFQMVPGTLPEARSCALCHSGHDHVGGGDCQQCHPAEQGLSNSFRVSARIAEPPPPTRDWPAKNGFSHLSPGHVLRAATETEKAVTCASCHEGFGLAEAETLAKVRVPDEAAKLCRDCHLEKQFHWR